jgi:hypothetical protein
MYGFMETGIENLKDLIEVIAWIVGAASLAFAAYTYRLNKNQLDFAVITSCTERFQRITTALKSSNGDEKLREIKQYIDLCNEELFYFKNGYLPQEVIDEWIDGMVFYLPHFKDGENINPSSDYISEIIQLNLLEDYPRIRRAFIVKKKYDLTSESERAELVRVVKRNLK